MEFERMPTDFMSKRANHNFSTAAAAVSAACSVAPTTGDVIRHIYVHIPFCARICPYCAFYKDLLDRSQTQRFCEAILGELKQHRQIRPSTIYFGGGTPTALTPS